MKRIFTLFDNSDYSETYAEIRKELYERFAEEYDWDYEIDVPDDMIQAEIAFREEIDFQYFKDKFTQLLSAGYCLLVGTCGRWNGPAKGGKFIETYNDFASAISHLDYLKIEDNNGHLYIYGYHHDGSDHYEIKQLTAKGYEYARNNYFAHSRKLHETIMNNSFYSRLPRLASL